MHEAPSTPFEIPGMGGQVGMINLSDMMGKAFVGANDNVVGAALDYMVAGFVLRHFSREGVERTQAYRRAVLAHHLRSVRMLIRELQPKADAARDAMMKAKMQ